MEEKIILGKSWSIIILVMALFAAQAISGLTDYQPLTSSPENRPPSASNETQLPSGTVSLTPNAELEYNNSRNVASK